MRVDKVKRKHMRIKHGELLTEIPKSFLKAKVLPLSVIRKEYRAQIGHDECHRLNAGGWYYWCDTNPIFTSRNSHKKTNRNNHGKRKSN